MLHGLTLSRSVRPSLAECAPRSSGQPRAASTRRSAAITHPSSRVSAKHADHGGSGRQIERRRGRDPHHAHQCTEAPANEKTTPDGRTQRRAGQGGHDEVGEDEQHPGDADGAGDDQAERCVEDEIPQRGPASPRGRRPPDRSRSERTGAGTASGEGRWRRRARPPGPPRARYTVMMLPTSMAAQVLGAVRGVGHEEHGGRRGDGVDHADDGLLGHVTLPAAGAGRARGPRAGWPRARRSTRSADSSS